MSHIKLTVPTIIEKIERINRLFYSMIKQAHMDYKAIIEQAYREGEQLYKRIIEQAKAEAIK